MHNKFQKYPQFVSNFPLLLLLKVYSTLSVLTQCICRTKYQSSCFLQISFLLPFSYTIHVHVTSHNLHKIPRHYKPQNALSPVIFLSNLLRPFANCFYRLYFLAKNTTFLVYVFVSTCCTVKHSPQ